MVRFNLISAAIRVCVDGVENGHLCGRVYSHYVSEPLSFFDAGDLVLKIESILDIRQFPQAFQRTRMFVEKEAAAPAVVSNPECGLPDEVISAARGEKATFLVSVLSRQNATWQGSVDWLDGNPPQPFSSDLEFLRLIDRRIN